MTRLLTVKQVSEQLGFDPQTVRKYARSGDIPALRFGRTFRFHPNILERLMNTHDL